MKKLLDQWNIVLAGAWNTSILAPDWVARELVGVEQIEVEMVSLISPPGKFKLRYSTDDFIIWPRSNSLIFESKVINDDVLRKMENCAAKVLELLPYTPISAFGINFGFEDENAEQGLINFFDLTDDDKLVDYGAKIASVEIRRSIIKDNKIINISLSTANGVTKINFNFHFPISNAREASDKISNAVIPCKEIAADILNKVYLITNT